MPSNNPNPIPALSATNPIVQPGSGTPSTYFQRIWNNLAGWVNDAIIAVMPLPGNPSATISGTVVDGSATTFMRSDAAPALSETGVSAGSYTLSDLTIDAYGRITAASDGSPAASGINQLTGDVTAGPGTGSQVATLATVNSDVGSYTLASVTVNAKGLVTAASSGTAPPSAANPSAKVELTVTNGSATTFMRSDAAPPLDQSIAPTWTAVHTFDGTSWGSWANGYLQICGLNTSFPSLTANGEGAICLGNNTGLSLQGQGDVADISLYDKSNNLVLEVLTGSAKVALPYLTASELVATDANKNLVSITALPNGTTATTQSAGDNSTNVATTAYVNAVSIPTGANPTATAGPTAIDGSATTYMRSDAAPAVQVATSSQFGIVEVDGTVITSTSGVITVPSIIIQSQLDNYYSGASGNITGTGSYNTANGFHALYSNTTGNYNTAAGAVALYSNTMGSYNTAAGAVALYSNTTGNYNIAGGYEALYSNTTGSYNTANGFRALYSNTTGNYNFADGYSALYSNTTGSYNTANGLNALRSNTTGNYNVAVGYEALYYNTTGSSNTANGNEALFDLGSAQTAGSFNVGTSYTIATIGTTDFTLIGAASNTVGVVFTATGVGAGTGTATPNATNSNTAIGYNTGRGIVYGINNTIIGANVTGLSAGLTGAIILATGDGTIQADYAKTTASTWTFGVIATKPMAVSALPAAGTAGRRSFVTNATATTFASIVAGGGTNGVPVYDDGTNWRIG